MLRMLSIVEEIAYSQKEDASHLKHFKNSLYQTKNDKVTALMCFFSSEFKNCKLNHASSQKEQKKAYENSNTLIQVQQMKGSMTVSSKSMKMSLQILQKHNSCPVQ